MKRNLIGIALGCVLVFLFFMFMPYPVSASPRTVSTLPILEPSPISRVRDSCTALIRVGVRMDSVRIDTLIGMAVLPCPDGSGRTMRNLLQNSDAESSHD